MLSGPTENSTALLAAIASSDTDAFRGFYDAHATLVYSFALRLVRTQPEAQELLQDVFMQVWRTASSFNPKRGNPEAWLMTITRSRAIDSLRSRRRRDGRMLLSDDLAQVEDENSRLDKTGHGDVAASVEGALERLSDPAQELLRLVYFEGLTQTEIAQRLNLPLGTVKTRIRASLKRLREHVMPTTSKHA